MFNVYHEKPEMSDQLYEENICIGMSPNSSSSYAFDNAKGELGFAANATDLIWRGNIVGRIAPDPFDLNPLTLYDGIQYGPFSSTTGLTTSGTPGNPGVMLLENNIYLEDGTGW